MRIAFLGFVVALIVGTTAFVIAVDRRAFEDEGSGLLAWWAVMLGWAIVVGVGVAWLIARARRPS